MSGSVESGRPTPTRTRWKSGEPSSRLSDFSPLWPASPPPSRDADVAERQVDLVVDDEHAVEVELVGAARRADRAARPRSCTSAACSTATRGPPGPVRPSVSSPANFFFGFGRSQRSISASATWKPTLCGVSA